MTTRALISDCCALAAMKSRPDSGSTLAHTVASSTHSSEISPVVGSCVLTKRCSVTRWRSFPDARLISSHRRSAQRRQERGRGLVQHVAIAGVRGNLVVAPFSTAELVGAIQLDQHSSTHYRLNDGVALVIFGGNRVAVVVRHDLAARITLGHIQAPLVFEP